MKTIYGDLFDQSADAICITTNGFVKKNGECVMGMGCAKHFKDMFPQTPAILGDKIKQFGNITQPIIRIEKTTVVAFPVKAISETFNGQNAVKHMAKQLKIGKSVPGWACKARLSIINKSAKRLVKLADENNWNRVVLPRPGCGAGELNWRDVKESLENILDDRFEVITFKY